MTPNQNEYTLCPCGADHGSSPSFFPTVSESCPRGFMKSLSGVDYGNDKAATLAFIARIDQAAARLAERNPS